MQLIPRFFRSWKRRRQTSGEAFDGKFLYDAVVNWLLQLHWRLHMEPAFRTNWLAEWSRKYSASSLDSAEAADAAIKAMLASLQMPLDMFGTRNDLPSDFDGMKKLYDSLGKPGLERSSVAVVQFLAYQRCLYITVRSA